MAIQFTLAATASTTAPGYNLSGAPVGSVFLAAGATNTLTITLTNDDSTTAVSAIPELEIEIPTALLGTTPTAAEWTIGGQKITPPSPVSNGEGATVFTFKAITGGLPLKPGASLSITSQGLKIAASSTGATGDLVVAMSYTPQGSRPEPLGTVGSLGCVLNSPASPTKQHLSFTVQATPNPNASPASLQGKLYTAEVTGTSPGLTPVLPIANTLQVSLNIDSNTGASTNSQSSGVFNIFFLYSGGQRATGSEIADSEASTSGLNPADWTPSFVSDSAGNSWSIGPGSGDEPAAVYWQCKPQGKMDWSAPRVVTFMFKGVVSTNGEVGTTEMPVPVFVQATGVPAAPNKPAFQDWTVPGSFPLVKPTPEIFDLTLTSSSGASEATFTVELFGTDQGYLSWLPPGTAPGIPYSSMGFNVGEQLPLDTPSEWALVYKAKVGAAVLGANINVSAFPVTKLPNQAAIPVTVDGPSSPKSLTATFYGYQYSASSMSYIGYVLITSTGYSLGDKGEIVISYTVEGNPVVVSYSFALNAEGIAMATYYLSDGVDNNEVSLDGFWGAARDDQSDAMITVKMADQETYQIIWGEGATSLYPALSTQYFQLAGIAQQAAELGTTWGVGWFNANGELILMRDYGFTASSQMPPAIVLHVNDINIGGYSADEIVSQPKLAADEQGNFYIGFGFYDRGADTVLPGVYEYGDNVNTNQTEAWINNSSYRVGSPNPNFQQIHPIQGPKGWGLTYGINYNNASNVSIGPIGGVWSGDSVSLFNPCYFFGSNFSVWAGDNNTMGIEWRYVEMSNLAKSFASVYNADVEKYVYFTLGLSSKGDLCFGYFNSNPQDPPPSTNGNGIFPGTLPFGTFYSLNLPNELAAGACRTVPTLIADSANATLYLLYVDINFVLQWYSAPITTQFFPGSSTTGQTLTWTQHTAQPLQTANIGLQLIKGGVPTTLVVSELQGKEVNISARWTEKGTSFVRWHSLGGLGLCQDGAVLYRARQKTAAPMAFDNDNNPLEIAYSYDGFNWTLLTLTLTGLGNPMPNANPSTWYQVIYDSIFVYNGTLYLLYSHMNTADGGERTLGYLSGVPDLTQKTLTLGASRQSFAAGMGVQPFFLWNTGQVFVDTNPANSVPAGDSPSLYAAFFQADSIWIAGLSGTAVKLADSDCLANGIGPVVYFEGGNGYYGAYRNATGGLTLVKSAYLVSAGEQDANYGTVTITLTGGGSLPNIVGTPQLAVLGTADEARLWLVFVNAETQEITYTYSSDGSTFSALATVPALLAQDIAIAPYLGQLAVYYRTSLGENHLDAATVLPNPAL